MKRLILLDSAKQDLSEIARYIARQAKNVKAGRRFANTLRDQCIRLASLPGTLGHPRPEYRADMRSFPFKGFIIFFRYGTDTLEVINIVAAARDLAAVFTDPED